MKTINKAKLIRDLKATNLDFLLSEQVYKGLFSIIERQDMYREYVVRFSGHEGENEIRVKVKQIDRSNGADDIEVVREYILNNYGYKDYEIIDIGLIEEVIL